MSQISTFTSTLKVSVQGDVLYQVGLLIQEPQDSTLIHHLYLCIFETKESHLNTQENGTCLEVHIVKIKDIVHEVLT
jgi:hypothetical protein